jgi:hypothetical protein
MTSGSSIIVSVQKHRRRHWPSSWTKELGTPNSPAIHFTRGTVFAATLVRNCYGLSGCWPPCTDLTGLPANGGFYFQAFDGSVTLSVAGYNYNSVWTPLLAGLPPAGMAASLAALVRPCGARGFRRSGSTVSHQCIRPPIGACAPGHHGYQRACDLISGQASTGPFGSVRMRREDRSSIVVSSSRRPRRAN